MANAPAPSPPPAPSPGPPFEIGLVMAGAISAGAYTAGVIDFLIQALDAWEEAKKDTTRDDAPRHRVLLRVMAGASAGGMTAGLAAGQLGMNFESVTQVLYPPSAAQAPKNNNLYQSWVNKIDISRLLETADLADPNAGVNSVLDLTVLGEIAEGAFAYDDPADRIDRSYLADPLHVFLTVTNLRGVPYNIGFDSGGLIEYVMQRHADSMYFVRCVSATTAVPAGALRLGPDPNSWTTLQHSALATGAFPVGLAPQLLSRPATHYRSRPWVIPGLNMVDGKPQCGRVEQIDPYWPNIDQACQKDPDYAYEFLCVDGGVMNNEPIDLARMVLAETAPVLTTNDQAMRAILMVEPFPTPTDFPDPWPPPSTLISVLMATFNSLVSQARFKPEEVVLAADPKDYSRFLVVPERQETGAAASEPFAIACGSLQGFGGFLSRAFREHDYQLGRRNCQRFLMKHFALPCDPDAGQVNPLFDGNWSDAARSKYRIVRSRQGAIRAGKDKVEADDLVLLPIIPVMDSVAAEIPLVPWPSYSEADDLPTLQTQVEDRLDAVVKRLIERNAPVDTGNLWTLRLGTLSSEATLRAALETAWRLKRGEAVDFIINYIKNDLATRGLLQ